MVTIAPMATEHSMATEQSMATRQPIAAPSRLAADDSPNQQPTPNQEPWRVGRRIPINIYEGDRPICQCHTAIDAATIVRAVNSWLIARGQLKRSQMTKPDVSVGRS